MVASIEHARPHLPHARGEFTSFEKIDEEIGVPEDARHSKRADGDCGVESRSVDPLEPALGATLGASLGFMMPISTPPNAIVYSSGYIPLGAMVRNGLILDIVGYFIILAGVLTLGGLLS